MSQRLWPPPLTHRPLRLLLLLSPELWGSGAPCPAGQQWEPAPSQQSHGMSGVTSDVSRAVPQTGKQYAAFANREHGELSEKGRVGKDLKTLPFMGLSVSVFMYVHMHVGAHGGQKRASGPLDLEFQVLLSGPAWVLGSELRSPREQPGALASLRNMSSISGSGAAAHS